LGVTLITQRPAVITKDVISQSDVFFFMHMVDSNDVKVLNEILTNAGMDKEEKRKIKAKIVGFKQGEALLFSPTWMNTIKSFKVSKKLSYHAGRTPMLGEEEMPDPPLLSVYKDDIIKSLNEFSGVISGKTNENTQPGPIPNAPIIFYGGLGMALTYLAYWMVFLD